MFGIHGFDDACNQGDFCGNLVEGEQSCPQPVVNVVGIVGNVIGDRCRLRLQ